MAVARTVDQTIRAIFDRIAAYNVRADQVVTRAPIEVELQNRGFRASEIDAAYDAALERELITFSGAGGKFIKLTEKGFAYM